MHEHISLISICNQTKKEINAFLPKYWQFEYLDYSYECDEDGKDTSILELVITNVCSCEEIAIIGKNYNYDDTGKDDPYFSQYSRLTKKEIIVLVNKIRKYIGETEWL